MGDPAGAVRYTVPAGGGVITSWSMQAEAAGGTARLKVFRQLNSSSLGPFRVEGESALEMIEPNRLNTFTTHIVVTGGEELGLYASGPNVFFGGAAFDTVGQFVSGGNPPPGTEVSANNAGSPYRVNVAARLESDNDADGRGDDTEDNCPGAANAAQENLDGDPQGDACDPDDDNDGAADVSDNCPTTANADQANFDSDGTGDACGDAPVPGRCANPRAGTSDDDVMAGTAYGDSFTGLGGNDTLTGRGERDCLSGGRGRDTLSGGLGRDTLLGGPGNDHLSARDGVRDSVDCGSGRRDRATVDRRDRVTGCERVSRR